MIGFIIYIFIGISVYYIYKHLQTDDLIYCKDCGEYEGLFHASYGCQAKKSEPKKKERIYI